MVPVQPYFRDAVPGDLPAITAVVRGAPPNDAADRPATPAWSRRVLTEIDRRDDSFVLVAEFDGQIGSILQLVVFPTLSGGTTAQVAGLWTADRFRTSGIDALLLDHAVARADDLGCTRVQVMAAAWRRHERSFWERSGFVHLDAGYVRTTVVPLRRTG